MNLDEFRAEFLKFWQSVDREATAKRDSQGALDELRALYDSFDSYERRLADEVLAEWAISPDERLRFDALYLIDHFRITKVIPVLHQLVRNLANLREPGAPYEAEKVVRIITRLEEPSPPANC